LQESWRGMVYKRFCLYILSFTSLILCGTPAYLVNVGYESPKLVAPAVISLIPADNHKLFQVGMVGWSILLRSEFGFSKNLSFGLSQDLSPLNANASIYRYKSGERVDSLNYENSSYKTKLILKKKYRKKLTNQFSLILQKENIKGLENYILKFWDKPHLGLSFLGSYRDVGYEDFFNNQWDGKKIESSFEIFPGEFLWKRGYLSAGLGTKFKKYHSTVSAKYFFSENLNTVNEFIVGGTWELELLDFLPGSHYGEYRIDNGLLINGRFDKILSESLIFGYRVGILNFNKVTETGHGIKLVKIHQGIVFNLSSSISGSALSNKHWNRLIISSGFTFGVI